jgi:hypothetical protein
MKYTTALLGLRLSVQATTIPRSHAEIIQEKDEKAAHMYRAY